MYPPVTISVSHGLVVAALRLLLPACSCRNPAGSHGSLDPRSRTYVTLPAVFRFLPSRVPRANVWSRKQLSQKMDQPAGAPATYTNGISIHIGSRGLQVTDSQFEQ